MFHIRKNSQIVEVGPDITLSDYEKLLNREGFTGGYRPLTGFQIRLGDCLEKRIPNLFFLRYGSIEDLCVGGTGTLASGESFVIKAAPRAACGPDFRKMIIGSEGLFGKFKDVLMRIFPLPAYELWGLALYEHPAEAQDGLRNILGLMIRPLFAKILSEEEGNGLLQSLNLAQSDKTVLVFKLGGLKRMVEAEKETIWNIHDGKKVFFYWPSRPAERDILDETLVTPDGYRALAARCPELLGLGTTHRLSLKNDAALRKKLGGNTRA